MKTYKSVYTVSDGDPIFEDREVAKIVLMKRKGLLNDYHYEEQHRLIEGDDKFPSWMNKYEITLTLMDMHEYLVSERKRKLKTLDE